MVPFFEGRAGNAASRSVMEKLGMTFERSERHAAGEEVFYSVSREEFEGPPGSMEVRRGRET
jgi:RimJ/RimL family protein N-acetyltransferase